MKITDPRRPYIVVANHQSFVDILLISQLPWEMKWLSKEDFFRYPLVGWLMRMAGDVKLIRGQRESVVAAMDSCRDRLSKRVSVMIFPEGTRSGVTDAEVRVLEPIETVGLTLDDVSTLRDRVHTVIADELALMKAG